MEIKNITRTQRLAPLQSLYKRHFVEGDTPARPPRLGGTQLVHFLAAKAKERGCQNVTFLRPKKRESRQTPLQYILRICIMEREVPETIEHPLVDKWQNISTSLLHDPSV